MAYTFQFTSVSKGSSADYILQSDGWNDFGYLTLFNVFAGPKITHTDTWTKIGYLRIGVYGSPIQVDFIEMIPRGIFSQVPLGFFSWSFDITLFENLAIYLNPAERQCFISQLNLCLPNSTEFDKVRREPCYRWSQYRPNCLREGVPSVPEMTDYLKECQTIIDHFLNDKLINNVWLISGQFKGR